MAGAELMRVAVRALELTLHLSAPVLLASVVVGVIVGVAQSITQVQDATLSFVPKLFTVALTLALVGGSMGTELVHFTEAVFVEIPNLVR